MMIRLLAVGLALSVSAACSRGKADRDAIRGSMWLASIEDTTGKTKGHVLLEFSENTATMIPLFQDELKYVIIKDTIVVFTTPGTIRFTLKGDSLSDESYGWVFRRAR